MFLITFRRSLQVFRPSTQFIATILGCAVLFSSGVCDAKLKEGELFPSPKVAGFPGAKKFDLKSLQGKAVIVDFWASWCEPCKLELPALEKIFRKYQKQGLIVVGVNVDDDVKEAKAFLKSSPVSFDLVHDKGQKTSSLIGIEKMPTSFILSNGKIIKKHEAFRSGDEKKIEAEVRSVLGLK